MDRRSKIEDCVGVLPHNLRSSPLCGKGYEKFFVDFSSIFRSRWIEDRRSKIVWGCCRTIFDPPPCGGGSTKNFSWIFRRFFVACWIEDCGATPPHNLRASIFDPPATKILRNIFRRSAESPCTKCKSYEYKLLTNCKFRFVTARVFGLKKRKVYWL